MMFLPPNWLIVERKQEAMSQIKLGLAAFSIIKRHHYKSLLWQVVFAFYQFWRRLHIAFGCLQGKNKLLWPGYHEWFENLLHFPKWINKL